MWKVNGQKRFRLHVEGQWPEEVQAACGRSMARRGSGCMWKVNGQKRFRLHVEGQWPDEVQVEGQWPEEVQAACAIHSGSC